jgi:uncharacterized protein YcfL
VIFPRRYVVRINQKRIKPMFRVSIATYILATGFVLAGCHNNPTPPIYGHDDPFVARQIHFDSQDLQGDTAVNKPIVSRAPSGNLIVTVPIRSNIDRDLHVDYRATFFDATGAPIGEPTSWFPVLLSAHTPSSVTVKATSPAAANFQVDFRYAQ